MLAIYPKIQSEESKQSSKMMMTLWSSSMSKDLCSSLREITWAPKLANKCKIQMVYSSRRNKFRKLLS